ncbi:MAG: SDR family oxidoreductase, partial [Chthoniobacterales bacterium]
QANSAANKAGLIGFTKSIARDVASRRLPVNSVAPGLLDTDMPWVLSEEVRKVILSKIPLNSLGQPGDIAHAVAFLASPEAKYITGQVLAVDGGMVM